MGSIITFYSYKGGTGRSMALANVAWILASRGSRVLVIDWDLEAPGLHRYYHPFLRDRELTASEGVIDFVVNYATAAVTPPEDDDEHPDEQWAQPFTNMLRYATSLNWESFEKPGTLDFVPAGRQCPAYGTTVNFFNWQQFYEKLGGGVFLEQTRERMKKQYDYVLIDSRTGISDTSGICTIQMPDLVVLCFTMNIQSIEGAAAVAESIVRSGRSIRVFPVPMRIEKAEKAKLDRRRREAWKRFRIHVLNQIPDEQRKSMSDQQLDNYVKAYWGEIEILYDPWYAYEEVLATFGDLPFQKDSMLSSYEVLTSRLTDGAVTRMKPVTETQREIVLARYQPIDTTGNEEVDRSLTQMESVFSTLSTGDQDGALRLLKRLVRVPETNESGKETRRSVPRRWLTDIPANVIDSLIDARVIKTSGEGKDAVVELPDDALLEAWTPFREALETDREFLQWRQKFSRDAEYWAESGQSRDALLRGSLLSVADQRARWRSSDLNDIEKTFIRRSRNAKIRRDWLIAAAVLLPILVLIVILVRRQGTDYQVEQIIAEAPHLEDDPDATVAHSAWIRSLAALGLHDKARASIELIPDPRCRAQMFAFYTTLVAADERTAALKEAASLASRIPDPADRAMALLAVTRAAARTQPAFAAATIRKAGDAALAFANERDSGDRTTDDSVARSAKCESLLKSATDAESAKSSPSVITHQESEDDVVGEESQSRQADVVRVLTPIAGAMDRSNLDPRPLFGRAQDVAELAPADGRATLLLEIANEMNATRLKEDSGPVVLLALKSISAIDAPRAQADMMEKVVTAIAVSPSVNEYVALLDFFAKQQLRVSWQPSLVKAIDGLVDLGFTRETARVWTEANRLARSLPVPIERCGAMAAMAKAWHEVEEPLRVRETFRDAAAYVSSLPGALTRIKACGVLAQAARVTGDGPLADEMFERAKATLEKITDEEERGRAYADLALAAARTQQPGVAYDLAGKIQAPGPLTEEGWNIAIALGERQLLDEAVAVAKLIPDPYLQSAALRELVTKALAQKKPDAVAEQIAKAVTDGALRDAAVYDIAIAKTTTNANTAMDYARKDLYSDKLRALVALKAAEAETSRGNREAAGIHAAAASLYAQKLTDARERSSLLADVALLFARIGNRGSARETATLCTVRADKLRAYAGILEASVPDNSTTVTVDPIPQKPAGAGRGL